MTRALLLVVLLSGCASLNPFAKPEPEPVFCVPHQGTAMLRCERSPGVAYLQSPGLM